jgi:hypothetical protein
MPQLNINVPRSFGEPWRLKVINRGMALLRSSSARYRSSSIIAGQADH